jgi:hypothetical protein
MMQAIRTTIATAALMFAPLVARAAESAPVAPPAGMRCATAKSTTIDPVTGEIRIQTRAVCVVGGGR